VAAVALTGSWAEADVLLLVSTSDKLQVVTGSAVTVDVHASYVDRAAGTDTPGRKNTAITTATTTDVVLAPASATYRNVRRLVVRNKHATSSVQVTVQHTDGTTVAQLDSRVLGPGQAVTFDDHTGWFPVPAGGRASDPWESQLAGCMNRGDPGLLIRQMQCAGNVAPTPTNITASIARCSLFSLPFDLTVKRIRFYGVGITSNIYTAALYRLSDLARLTNHYAFSTAAATWGDISGADLAIALTKDVPYFMAVSANTTGTTAGIAAAGGTVAATTGQIATAPASLPGSLALGNARLCGYYFQFAVTAGAMPATAATLVAQAAWTGGMPAFFLDAA